MSEKNELKEENLEQVSGGRYYGVGAHIVCFRGIKWEVLSVDSSGGCRAKAISWPDNWAEWVKAIDYIGSIPNDSIVGTW